MSNTPPSSLRPRSSTRPSSLARLGALALGLAAVAASCSSTPDCDARVLTKKEKLGVYLENAYYYMELGEVDRAIGQAEKALELDPGNELFLLIYGRGYLYRGTAPDIQRSIDALRAIRDMEEVDDWRYHSTLGMALERKGILYEEAAEGVASGERATDADDPIARASELRAEAEGYYREARDHFLEAIDPETGRTGETEPLNGLVRVSGLLGELDEAVKWSEELLSSIESAERLLEDELQTPNLDADREGSIFRSLRSFRNLEIKARLALANIEYRRENYEQAAEQLDIVTVMAPDLEQAYSQRAQALFEMGDYRRAKDSIQRYIELRATGDGALTDPAVKRAFELSEACDRALSRNG